MNRAQRRAAERARKALSSADRYAQVLELLTENAFAAEAEARATGGDAWARITADALSIARQVVAMYRDSGAPFAAMLYEVREGVTADQLARKNPRAVPDPRLAEPGGDAKRFACRDGCAWCCMNALPVYVSRAELRNVAAAVVGKGPDGRALAPTACPALDPVTRTCRAYDDRPMVCRGSFSVSEESCRRYAEGGANPTEKTLRQTYHPLMGAMQAISAAATSEQVPACDLKAALADMIDNKRGVDAAFARHPVEPRKPGEMQEAGAL